jgi:cell wall-associated NlpC family hydrolase
VIRVENISTTAADRGRALRVRAARLVPAVVVAAAAAILPLSGDAGADQFSDQIANAQAQASQLTSQIQAEGQHLEVLSQQYDAAQEKVQQLDLQITQTTAQIQQTKGKVSAAQKVLHVQALAAYMSGSSNSGLDQLFHSAEGAAIAAEYRSVAGANLTNAIDQLHAAQNALSAQQSQLQNTESQTRTVIAQVATTQQQAQAAEVAQQATLNQVKGQIATLVAQQQAAQQAAEEAAFQARVAAEQAAQQAAAQRAAQQAAAQASGGSGSSSSSSSGSGGTTVLSGAPPVSNAPPAAGASKAVQAAQSQLGVTYVWGAESPGVAFDCSGLTQWAWGQAGVSLPRTAADQYNAIVHISLSSLQPGDLLFWNDGTTSVQHVAMYVGGGKVIQAPQTGQKVSYATIWNNGLVGAGRP